jgi:hypothetical protein
MTEQQHLPYEEEAQLFTDIVNFFTDRLPHAIGETAELLDEAALSKELFEVLSTETDDELAGSAAASGLFVVANNRRKN